MLHSLPPVLPGFCYVALLSERSDGDFEPIAVFARERLELLLLALDAESVRDEAAAFIFLGDCDCPSILEDSADVFALTCETRARLTELAEAA